MINNIKRISDYIDRLNIEQQPLEHENMHSSRRFKMLSKTVRLVRTLKEPTLPEDGFPKRLAASIAAHGSKASEVCSKQEEKQRGSAEGETLKTSQVCCKQKDYGREGVTGQISKKSAVQMRRKIAGTAIAAILMLVFALSLAIPPIARTNIVLAMERAIEDVQSYHGILEIVMTNKNGEEFIQAKREVYTDKKGRYWVKELDGINEGFVTVNNGEKKWQVRPDEEKVYLFEAFPDAYRFTFELDNEVNYVKNAAKVTACGEETVAGRDAVIFEVSPHGGQTYKIWVDKETKLPLQKETSMQNALQYKVTYTEIELNSRIPAEVLSYRIPEGYSVVVTNPEQMVNDAEEAQMLAGFAPIAPLINHEEYELDGISVATSGKIIKFHYTSRAGQNKVIFLQGRATDSFKAASTAVLGKVGENAAEIMSPLAESYGLLSSGLYAGITDISSIHWQDAEYDYAVVGNASLKELAEFISAITGESVEFPEESRDQEFEPQVKVAVNMEIENNEQKSVDGGHTPWRLDPVFTSQVFVSLKIFPDGMEGDYPVAYEALEVKYNNGARAIIEVTVESPVRRVYLEKLIRQDSTGIWTVVGYDEN